MAPPPLAGGGRREPWFHWIFWIAKQLPAKRKGRGPLFLAQSKKIPQKSNTRGTKAFFFVCQKQYQYHRRLVEPTSSTPWRRGLPRRRPRRVNQDGNCHSYLWSHFCVAPLSNSRSNSFSNILKLWVLLNNTPIPPPATTRVGMVLIDHSWNHFIVCYYLGEGGGCFARRRADCLNEGFIYFNFSLV